MQTVTAAHRTKTDEDFTGIPEFAKRIGLLLCCPTPAGGIDVLMELSNRPSEYPKRLWKLPQRELLPETDLPGRNAEQFLADDFGLARSQVEMWEFWPVPLIDPIPKHEVRRVNRLKTITTWVSVIIEDKAMIPADDRYKWFPHDEVTTYCQDIRITNYTVILAMIDNLHPTPLN